MKFIIGKKIEMSQVWQEGKVVPVTKVQSGPCLVVQKKSKDKDGYIAVQLGFSKKKEKNIKKPQLGHLKKTGKEAGSPGFLREFRLDASQAEKLKVGDKIKVDTFSAGDKISVTGISKGKGFAGVVKRHGFSGTKKTHGNKDQLRMPGSIGATGPAHVFKGTRMAGRMGASQVTEKNLEVVQVDSENNTLLIKGALPGIRNNLVLIKGKGELKVEERKDEKKKEVKEEEKIKEPKPETAKKEEKK